MYYCIVKFCTLLIISMSLFSCHHTKQDLVGIYINNYHENLNKRLIPSEAPNGKDTLTLFGNGTYTSSYFGGFGTYEIKEINGTQSIILAYEEYGMKVAIDFIIRKSMLNNSPVINIDPDGIYY